MIIEKMEAAKPSGIQVNTWQSIEYHIPDKNLHQYQCENLKSHQSEHAWYH